MNPVSEPEIQHSATRNSFETIVDGRLAHADYDKEGELVYFTHTYVPPELEGRGIASQIIRYALEHAREQDWQVVALCPFVAAYIRRHPEYQPLLAQE
jgi:uncharacterized protein